MCRCNKSTDMIRINNKSRPDEVMTIRPMDVQPLEAPQPVRLRKPVKSGRGK